eukprot:scaffold179_cov118-Isochrysis_galbana.AAC.6
MAPLLSPRHLTDRTRLWLRPCRNDNLKLLAMVISSDLAAFRIWPRKAPRWYKTRRDVLCADTTAVGAATTPTPSSACT